MWLKSRSPLLFWKTCYYTGGSFYVGKSMPQTLPKGVNPDYVVLIDGVYYDLCVVCKHNTGVRTDCPVDRRKNYVETSGQLCEGCSDLANCVV